ncbi:MAG TPA: Na/Pi cotransporter [Lachnoclostridium phytofermentans]|uniref:Na/Pi cotransporter n=1 Tax=Lachnoclostridium phytofermentans TaxID=66219 RepID=A0A3D2XBF3_9FIRM|nr:Na/Pi cotransporter family protein [Lachnoclostridium sp.]HCL03923.1 Na/Pi cotransporter [Lachnoclostridium phytofermentans]
MKMESLLALIAGLGLFLYGMKLMSDGLEKAAGARLRSILEMCTKNQFVGMIVGILFTAVVQSSSATTVLVVSFVNAGLLNLMQATGVILGANIGTTVTAQLIAFNLSAVAPVFLMLGVCMVMFVKKPMIKRIGEVVLGFGMLFFGMSIMSGSMDSLRSSEQVMNIITSMDNPFLAVLVGFVITAIIQSSSATVGIVLVMASQGLIPLNICFYIILGCNMGSCVSALLASIGSKKTAKRAAWIHLLVNIIGSFVIFVILLFFENQIEEFIIAISGGKSQEIVNGVNQAIAREVANTHLIFKVFEVVICFPITKLIVKAATFIVPGEDKKVDSMQLEYITDHGSFQTTTAVPSAINEIVRMAQITFHNLGTALSGLLTRDENQISEVYVTENSINYLSREITNYLVSANQHSLPIDDRKVLASLFHVVNDIERIGDHAENVADFAKQAIDGNLYFSPEAVEEINKMSTAVQKLLSYSIEMFENKNREYLEEILKFENSIDDMERRFQKNHVVRLTKNSCSAETGMIFSDLLSNLERVADHGTNIAFSILDEDPEDV